MEKSRIAIVRVRGAVGVTDKVKDTMSMLRLYKKNYCVVVSSDKSYLGMLQKVKDYVTFGEIDEKTFTELLLKRGRLAGNKPLTEEFLKKQTDMSADIFSKAFMTFKKELKDVAGLKPFFRLTPPRKGFERGGIKKPFTIGGSLGYRKDKINDLIRRMV